LAAKGTTLKNPALLSQPLPDTSTIDDRTGIRHDRKQQLRLGLQITQREQVDRAADFAAEPASQLTELHLVDALKVNDQINVAGWGVSAPSHRPE
jgi:hypothetical protein